MVFYVVLLEFGREEVIKIEEFLVELMVGNVGELLIDLRGIWWKEGDMVYWYVVVEGNIVVGVFVYLIVVGVVVMISFCSVIGGVVIWIGISILSDGIFIVKVFFIGVGVVVVGLGVEVIL